MGTVGSAVASVSTIFDVPEGNTLYVTNTPSAALSGTLFVLRGTDLNATAFSNANITLTTSFPVTHTLSGPATYLPSRSFLVGVGANTFSGFANGTIYNGMQFTYNSEVYTIQSNSLSGSTYTLTLDKKAAIFVNQTITNVGIPANSFSILNVTGDTIGSGIYVSGCNQMYLSGLGIGSDVVIQSQISSEDPLNGMVGVHKISYSPNTGVQTMYANDKKRTILFCMLPLFHLGQFNQTCNLN